MALGRNSSSSDDEEMKRVGAKQLGVLVRHGGDWGLGLAKRILSGVRHRQRSEACRGARRRYL